MDIKLAKLKENFKKPSIIAKKPFSSMSKDKQLIISNKNISKSNSYNLIYSNKEKPHTN